MSFLFGSKALATRSAAMAVVLGAALLAAPLTATAGSATMPAHHGGSMHKETVEQRIASLHQSLKITPDEETNWTGVAQAMRDNEARMQKLVAEKTAEPPHDVNAIDDLKTYEKFTQAHVDGLKTLISSFETLYNAMPAGQKVLADHVFQKFSHRSRGANG